MVARSVWKSRQRRFVRSGDFQGLRALQKSFPKQFCRGVFLHFGEQVVPFGAKLWTVPLGSLWVP